MLSGMRLPSGASLPCTLPSSLRPSVCAFFVCLWCSKSLARKACPPETYPTKGPCTQPANKIDSSHPRGARSRLRAPDTLSWFRQSALIPKVGFPSQRDSHLGDPLKMAQNPIFCHGKSQKVPCAIGASPGSASRAGRWHRARRDSRAQPQCS